MNTTVSVPSPGIFRPSVSVESSVCGRQALHRRARAPSRLARSEWPRECALASLLRDRALLWEASGRSDRGSRRDPRGSQRDHPPPASRVLSYHAPGSRWSIWCTGRRCRGEARSCGDPNRNPTIGARTLPVRLRSGNRRYAQLPERCPELKKLARLHGVGGPYISPGLDARTLPCR